MAERYEDAHLSAVKVIGGNRAIVPIEPGYTDTKVIRGEPLLEGAIAQVRSLPSGEIENVVLPYSIDRITDFIADAKKNPKWDKLKRSAEKFRFGFGDGSVDGTNWSGFRAGSLADIAEYLQGYAQIKRGLSNNQNRSMMGALVLIRTRSSSEIEERIAEQRTNKVARIKAANKARYARLRKERKG